MRRWRCKDCGQVIEDLIGKGNPPKEHGVLHVRIGEPAISKKCKGTLEVIPDSWERTIKRLKNAN